MNSLTWFSGLQGVIADATWSNLITICYFCSYHVALHWTLSLLSFFLSLSGSRTLKLSLSVYFQSISIILSHSQTHSSIGCSSLSTWMYALFSLVCVWVWERVAHCVQTKRQHITGWQPKKNSSSHDTAYTHPALVFLSNSHHSYQIYWALMVCVCVWESD